METYRWPGEQPPAPHCAVATLGSFDGVHLGHRTIFQRVNEAAEEEGCPSAAITFHPHPSRVLGQSDQPMITSLDHRLKLMERLDLDICLLVEFTDETARMTAREFVDQILCDALQVRRVVLGFDCRFGKDREGDSQFCRKMGQERGFEVETVPPVRAAGEIVSSTAIRRAVSRGDVQHAASLLGRPYSLYGKVVHGDGRGHDLGWPTANLDLEGELMPAYAVYAGSAEIDDARFPAVISVGKRSTFHPSEDAKPVVEAHILEGNPENLYGKPVEVELYRWLRPQQKFDSAHELGEQIRRDVENCRRVLNDLQDTEETVQDGPVH